MPCFKKTISENHFSFARPAQAGSALARHFSKTALPTQENPRLLPVDRP
jgi:hypothetical protein